MKYKYLFGPVASRRLGLSLGVDIIPSKICNLDCIYCECGPTLTKTNERKQYAKPSAVIAELGNFLSASPLLDFVTITGSGEPTLNTGIGPIISFLKDEFPSYKTALLTNGTLLSDPDVCTAAMRFDYVLPSCDAVSRGVFASVNRPHPDLESGAMVRGLADFSRSYKGVLWLEVFLVPGVNDSTEELSLLKKAGHAIRPSRVQLNTLDRPGTVASVKPVPGKRLAEIADFLRPLPVEIISRRFTGQTGGPAAKELEPGVLALLRRRPSTIEDLAVSSRRSINELGPLLSRLEHDKAVTTETVNNHVFYKSNKSVASSTKKTG